MYERSSSLLLRWLKVPPEPQPPHGDPASLRVFRAGKNFFNLRLLTWGIGQAAALAGIIFWLVVFLEVESTIKERRTTAVPPTSVKDFKEQLEKIGAEEQAPSPAAAAAPAANPAAGAPTVNPAAATATEAKPTDPTPREPVKKKRPRVRLNGFAGFKALLVQVGLMLPRWSFPLIWALKIFGFVVYLVQVPLTYAVRRLDYELRWYMVTDRSLRIRHGVWKISESTMSFANIQQVVVSQGPLQRLLGLADVKVQSAGGGGSNPEAHQHGGEDMHLGLFHSVNNAPEIRDLILERLRRFRESGLGDPDEKVAAAPAAAPAAASAAPASALAAAQELLAEARALRTQLAGR